MAGETKSSTKHKNEEVVNREAKKVLILRALSMGFGFMLDQNIARVIPKETAKTTIIGLFIETEA